MHPVISVTDLAKLLAQSAQTCTILDVREPSEWQQSRLESPAVRHIPMAEIPHHMNDLPENQPLYVLCRSGGRSGKITDFLRRQGLDAINVSGGLLAWREQVDPNLPPP